MKYVISLVLGLIVGVVLFGAALVANPLTADRGLSPFAVTDAEVISLTYSNVPSSAIVYTNDGESRHQPHPVKTLQLWEAPVRLTHALVTVMRDARGQPAGIGVKFASESERTNLFDGEALIDSAWYVYLPGRGALFIHQTENFWSFLTDVVVPAWRSSSNTWKGNWNGDTTAGPGALGIAAVAGGSGEFAGLEAGAIETLNVRAFSMEKGLVSAEGRLTIEMPDTEREAEVP